MYKKPTHTPIHGVNLGNWLVLERWMEPKGEPGPFKGTKADDEFGLRRDLEPDELATRLQEHRQSYVTEQTFAWLAEQGCNLVRLPVPYYVFGNPTHESCIEYVDSAMSWAEACGIPVLIDLHTVPGGQNGFDNGGTSGLCTWHLESLQIRQTMAVLERLADRYATHPALFGIEAMNEPASPRIFKGSMARYGAAHPERVGRSAPIPHAVLAQFYRLVYERLRPILGPEVALVFHDQFQLNAWNSFMPANRYPNVWLDTHQYVGTLAASLKIKTLFGHVMAARAMGLRIAMAQRHHPVLVGEWSLGNNIEGLSNRTTEEQRKAYVAYARAQMGAFDLGMGSCFWSLRNGRRDRWSIEAAVEKGWIDLHA